MTSLHFLGYAAQTLAGIFRDSALPTPQLTGIPDKKERIQGRVTRKEQKWLATNRQEQRAVLEKCRLETLSTIFPDVLLEED